MNPLRCMAFASGALALSACGTRTIAVEVRFADQALADEATAIELFVVDRCSDVALGSVPTAARSRVGWRRGEPSMSLGGTLPERFGVLALARNEACDVVAAGCRDATRNDTNIIVPANAEAGAGCSACSRGVCGVERDGGVDAPVDASMPSDVWLPVDAAPDAGPPGEINCDCTDDDRDGTIDEGCLARGSGEMIWQTAFDGPGIQGFRGNALGGDGNLYINGWMEAGTTTLCGTPYTGGGIYGTSWTISLSPTSGSCVRVFERTNMPTDAPAPSSPFASPTRGRAGAWLFTPRAVVELSETTVLNEFTLNTMADYNSGFVRIHPTNPARSLIYFAPTSSPTTLGGATIDSTDASIVATVDGTTVRMTTSPLRSHAAWIDGTRWAVVAPNQLPATCTRPATPWRIEVHADAATPTSCIDVLPLDIDSNGGELAVAANATAVWVLTVQTDRSYRLIATRLSDGNAVSFPLPRAPRDFDTLTHLVAADDGTVFLGMTKGIGAEFLGSEGYVYHLALTGTGIRQLGMRRFAGGISGLELGPSNTLYVTGGAREWAMCSRTGAPMLSSADSATVVGAIQF